MSHRTFMYQFGLSLAMLLGAMVAKAESTAPPAVFVSTARVEPWVDRLEALGNLEARESVVLTATVTDTVSKIYFDDGDRVEAGQLLVALTQEEETAQLAEARAALAEADRQYRRVATLVEQGTASKSLYDERRREWDTARARLAALESRLADRLIKAPFAGVLGLRNLSPGALVQPGTVIATLDDDRVMKLEFNVPSRYLDLLRPDLAIEASTRAYPDQVFQGSLKAVDSRIDPVTRAVRARALLPNPDRLLKPGLLMHVVLLYNPRQALVIPETALMPAADKQFVFVLEGAESNKVVKRELQLGSRQPGKVEVVAGLQAGDKVVSDGTLKIRAGQAVKVTGVYDGSQPLPELLERAGQ